jgi:hypothetical protein
MQLRQIFPPERFILEFEGWPDIDQITLLVDKGRGNASGSV